jgi:DNA-binding LacI/PurR family transcriptional regulator
VNGDGDPAARAAAAAPSDGPPAADEPHPKSRGAARRAMRRGPTIDDVARVAGVSRGTVSRVLNGGRYVSPQALAAVERAVRESGYVANSSARSLVTRRSGAAAFVLSEPQERLFEDPNFSVLLRASTQALAGHRMSLVLMLASGPDQRQRVLEYVRAGHVDGILLVSSHSGDPIVEELERSNLPAVACGQPLGHEVTIPFVAADDREGARQMTRYLLGLGRRRIATVTGPLDTPGGQQRLAGYRETVGTRWDEALVQSAADYSYHAGEAAMERLLAGSPDLDAVFVASDLVAAGAIATLRRAGRRIPADVAVGGFDDSRIATTTEPPLTTVRNPLEEVAAEMVDLLLRRIAGERPGSRVLPVNLIRRASA